MSLVLLVKLEITLVLPPNTKIRLLGVSTQPNLFLPAARVSITFQSPLFDSYFSTIIEFCSLIPPNTWIVKFFFHLWLLMLPVPLLLLATVDKLWTDRCWPFPSTPLAPRGLFKFLWLKFPPITPGEASNPPCLAATFRLLCQLFSLAL